jgi:hypothetical protein
MKVPTTLINRVKFVLGVMAVMAAVRFATEAWELIEHSGRDPNRLEPYQLCKFYDCFLPPPRGAFAPSPCLVVTPEWQSTPSNNIPNMYERAWVDHDTLVLVIDDVEPRQVEIVQGTRVDARAVAVLYVTGPYSGRKGIVGRYKLDAIHLKG